MRERSGPIPVNERNTGTYSGSPEFVAGREAATRPDSRRASRRRSPPSASSWRAGATNARSPSPPASVRREQQPRSPADAVAASDRPRPAAAGRDLDAQLGQRRGVRRHGHRASCSRRWRSATRSRASCRSRSSCPTRPGARTAAATRSRCPTGTQRRNVTTLPASRGRRRHRDRSRCRRRRRETRERTRARERARRRAGRAGQRRARDRPALRARLEVVLRGVGGRAAAAGRAARPAVPPRRRPSCRRARRAARRPSRRPLPVAAAGRQRHAARAQDRARAALHEQLPVGVGVVLVRALSARARAEQQADHARVGELRHVRGAVAEEVLGAVVLVAGARAAVVGDVAVVRVAERDLPEDPALRAPSRSRAAATPRSG